MRFSASALVGFLATTSLVSAFAPLQVSTTRVSRAALASTTEEAAATEATEERPRRKKDERLRMMKSKQFHRKGFKEVREHVEDTMEGQFKSELVEDFKKNNYVIERDGVKVHLAKVRNM